ncbi:MAG: ABC transporter ATP-binding protein [Clostridia bacterium]|nr:ABC transporter ATP-binding protein [Clostridia bacterium]
MLELKNVFKNYYRGKTEIPVLNDINLSVEEGEYLAIMGPSGSGKTTLMNLIGCLDTPSAGEHLLNGRKINELDDNALADIRNREIGFVFQNFHLLPKMNALDNVALPLLYAGVSQKERRERAAEALKAVGLEERVQFFPNQLSGGQCQRVAIARAMVTNPKLLLADEPTGALDTASGDQIMEIFRELSDKGMTIIMITHELAVAERADKICRILDGRLLIPENEGVTAREEE